ncbi:ChrR family anti-sigma-E factor [uncultured Pseudoteredinibacter sp.]|uniref:ChrR family anti-sigma-E factor n=1 Tax=uncultured Pseudoteredinibacter sp. TaxID=1641701 RepID=UPI00263625AA|nr:ChrR family anti-sigma-E factor [uncultured Pseudoteredinibacter sp.]
MNHINHHPDEATLLSYAAGALPRSFAVLIDCHLEQCPQCHEKIFKAEAIAGEFIEHSPPIEANDSDALRDKFFAALDAEPTPQQLAHTVGNEPQLPIEVVAVLSGRDQELPWRFIVPGMHSITLNSSDLHSSESSLKLLRIAPGRNLPMHSHQGSELTMVLQGAFQDELGCFRPGDVADLDHEVEHQPITIGNEACICLVAMDAPLEFKSLVPKLLQPFIGF